MRRCALRESPIPSGPFLLRAPRGGASRMRSRSAALCFRSAASSPSRMAASPGRVATASRSICFISSSEALMSIDSGKRRMMRRRTDRVELPSMRNMTLPLSRASSSWIASCASRKASILPIEAIDRSSSASMPRSSSRLMRAIAFAAVTLKPSCQNSRASSTRLPSSGTSSRANMAARTSSPPSTR